VPNAVVGPVDGWLISANSENRANAEALVAFLASDPASQAKWAQVQGALSPNVKVDESTYTSVMLRALAAVGNADTFAFNYDLATTPPAAEYGLDLFARFMDDPAAYMQHLADTEEGVRGVFDR
jgi:multiple sugar transport system substrate-binding protein/raffinose/stachyose/melibiose transport system substrate-binding protein